MLSKIKDEIMSSNSCIQFIITRPWIPFLAHHERKKNSCHKHTITRHTAKYEKKELTISFLSLNISFAKKYKLKHFWMIWRWEQVLVSGDLISSIFTLIYTRNAHKTTSINFTNAVNKMRKIPTLSLISVEPSLDKLKHFQWSWISNVLDLYNMCRKRITAVLYQHVPNHEKMLSTLFSSVYRFLNIDTVLIGKDNNQRLRRNFPFSFDQNYCLNVI